MNIFKKFYFKWVSGINPEFNPKLLDTPTPNLKYIFIQPERLSEETVINDGSDSLNTMET